MKKTNFFKLLMVGAAALTLGLTSCNFVKESEFEDICEEVDLLKTDVSDLKTLLAGDFVKDVTVNAAGDVLTILYGTKPSVNLNLGSGNGEGTIVEIDDDGQIILDEQPSGWYLTDGAIAQGFYPKKSEDGKNWLFPNGEVGDDGEPVYVEGPSTLPGTFVVKDEVSGLFILNVPTAGGGMEEIVLLGEGSNIAKIDVLGWVTGKDGKADTDLKLNTPVAGGSPGNVDNNTVLDVKYAYITKFQRENNFASDDTAAQTAMADVTDPKDYFWVGTTTVKKKNILNTLAATRTGLIVNVHPATINLSQVKLSIENSQGLPLPIKVGTPVKSTGLLTRGADSGIWFVPLTFEEGKTYEKLADDYANLFETNALYSLVWNANLRSEYTAFTFTTTGTTSTEGLATVKDATVITAPVAGDPGTKGVYAVEVNKPYSISLPGGADNNVDYYVEVKGKNELLQTAFGVTIDVEAGTFTVTKQPDEITYANFDLTIYKLGIDGKIYVQDVTIRPAKANVSGTIAIGDYLVQDEDKDTGAGYLGTKTGKTLDPMFTELGSAETLRWKDATNGANKVTLKKVVIGGKEVNGSAYEDKVADDKPDLPTWITRWEANNAKYGFATKADGTGQIVLANGVGTGALNGTSFFYMEPAWARTATTQRMFDIGSTYELTFEFVHSEGGIDDYLSTAVVTFTPTIPSIDGMFVKETNNEGGLRYWDGSTLNGYYRAPEKAESVVGFGYYGVVAADAPWASSSSAATKGSTYYSVFADAVAVSGRTKQNPADGGYNKFPLGAPTTGTTKTWSLGASLDYREKDGDGNPSQVIAPDASDPNKTIDKYVKFGAAGSTQAAIVELIDQTPNATTSAIGYDTPLKLKVVPGKYLGVYDYPESDDLNFDLVINSAVEKGEIVGTSAGGMIDIQLGMTGDYYSLFAADFKATNVAGMEYSLFTVNGKYAYTYVEDVKFSVPAGVTIYELVGGTTVNGVVSASEINNALDANNDPIAPHIGITSHTGLPGTADLNVTVYDRFGKAQKATVKLNFKN